MGIGGNSLFLEWDQAAQRLAWRQLAFERAEAAFPKTHPLYKHTEKELQNAHATLDSLIAQANAAG